MTARSPTWLAASWLALPLLAPGPPVRAQEGPVVEITARRFQFSPAEIHLRRGEPVTLRLRTEDITHGFFAKALGIDELIEPGKVTQVKLTPAQAGRYPVICDHFCGAGHGGMKLLITVE